LRLPATAIEKNQTDFQHPELSANLVEQGHAEADVRPMCVLAAIYTLLNNAYFLLFSYYSKKIYSFFDK
jgi:hypothetical protein